LLHRLGVARMRLRWIAAELAQRPALPQQVPALVELGLHRGEAPALFGAELTALEEPVLFAHEALDVREYGSVGIGLGHGRSFLLYDITGRQANAWSACSLPWPGAGSPGAVSRGPRRSHARAGAGARSTTRPGTTRGSASARPSRGRDTRRTRRSSGASRAARASRQRIRRDAPRRRGIRS